MRTVVVPRRPVGSAPRATPRQRLGRELVAAPRPRAEPGLPVEPGARRRALRACVVIACLVLASGWTTLASWLTAGSA